MINLLNSALINSLSELTRSTSININKCQIQNGERRKQMTPFVSNVKHIIQRNILFIGINMYVYMYSRCII